MAVTGLVACAGAGSRSVVVVNGLASERTGMATVTVTLDEPGTPWLAVIDSEVAADLPAGTLAAEVPALAEGVRRHPDGSLAQVTLTFRASRVPALGVRRYALRAVPATVSTDTALTDTASTDTASRDIAGSTAIENDAVAVTADAARGGT